MTSAVRTRKDPRRETTRVALIEAAEALFADAGIEAVSLRQIGAATGALNTNVVAYHFGGKDALIEAVFHHRLPQIDARRGELLERAETAGECTIPSLLRVFALPLFEQTDAGGKHSFALFLTALERSGMTAARGLVMDDYPFSERVTRLLIGLLPSNLRFEGGRRMRLVVSLLSTALQIIDRDGPGSAEAAARQFDTAITMAAAAFAASSEEGIIP